MKTVRSISDFPWAEAEFDQALKKAVATYWRGRGGQSQRQGKTGGKDRGTRSEVTGGQHLNAGLELPGYYRPQKKWDLVVVRNGRLCAAVELKSQAGSFGNNFNNRSEEAIGNSTDFWTAFREGALGLESPWLGYFFLLEEAKKSLAPVALKTGSFPPLAVFEGTSYAERYAILCERLVLERKYNRASFVLSPRSRTGKYSEPKPELGFLPFVKSLHAHLVGCH